MAGIYLSIDIDYWDSPEEATLFLHKTLEESRKRKIPIKMVFDHHKLLPHINKIDANRIINIDAHSDISENPFSIERGTRILPRLNCGTWGNYATKYKHFEWWGGKHSGWCHSWENPFRKRCTHYRKVIRKTSMGKIPWSQVRGIGIALSRDYLRGEMVGSEIEGKCWQIVAKRIPPSKWKF